MKFSKDNVINALQELIEYVEQDSVSIIKQEGEISVGLGDDNHEANGKIRQSISLNMYNSDLDNI